MTISVLTLNIWHDSGPWSARVARIRAWIERLDPDLIGLQEVLRGPGCDQLAEIFDGFPHHCDYAVAAKGWRSEDLSFGNAVASRWPIVERRELRLPDGGDGETRAALTVLVEAPVGRVSFTCTHLNWRFHQGAVRERQVQAVAEQVLATREKQGFPPILVGDFNAEPESDEIRFLSGLHSLEGRSVYFQDAWRVVGSGSDGITWSNRNPQARVALEHDRRIDYVFAGYPRLDGVGLLERCLVVCNEPAEGIWPSDHFGVYAELRTTPVEGAFAVR